tara:strand:- start:1040 stop:1216 length:177 start_codon:yes stop_codon:yes gene_type:complete
LKKTKDVYLIAHDEVDEISERVIWFADGESFNINLLPSHLSRMRKSSHKEIYFFTVFS